MAIPLKRAPHPSPPLVLPDPDARPSLSVVHGAAKAEDGLIWRLALDRLRDLRDDGVTSAYIGRMYGVSCDRMESVERELRRGCRRGARSAE